MRICDVLKNLRESRSLSQLEMSRRSGISQATISAIELGIRQPSMDMLGKLSDFFGVPISTFIGEYSVSEDDDLQKIIDSMSNNHKLRTLFDVSQFLPDEDIEALIHVATCLGKDYGK